MCSFAFEALTRRLTVALLVMSYRHGQLIILLLMPSGIVLLTRRLTITALRGAATVVA